MNSSAAPLPDSQKSRLWDRLPPAWAPYIQLARLDRPAGWQLLLGPCLTAVCLASVFRGQGPNFALLALLTIGSIAMRGAGSTFNDIVDRHIDGKVARTAGRPLPSGRVSLTGAIIFMLAQTAVGLAVLLALNPFAQIVALASIVPVAIYPFMKRFTSWPQAVLGLAFSWGALAGFAAQAGELAAPAFWLYVSGWAWTIGYDTIYAIQDRKYDVAAGVKSTALLFGDKLPLAVGLFYAFALGCAFMAFWSAGANWIGFLGFAAFAAHLVWQLTRLASADETLALKLFRSNGLAGFLPFLGLLAQSLGALHS